MRPHERRGNGEAEAGPATLVLGREERVAEPSLMLWRDPGAFIFDGEEHAALCWFKASGDHHPASWSGQCLEGIDDEIDDDLLHMLAHALHRRNVHSQVDLEVRGLAPV
jgi:hypothetical protein